MYIYIYTNSLLAIIILQASSRAAYNLKVVNSKKHLDLFDNFNKISRNICDGGGCVQLNPLGF